MPAVRLSVLFRMDLNLNFAPVKNRLPDLGTRRSQGFPLVNRRLIARAETMSGIRRLAPVS